MEYTATRVSDMEEHDRLRDLRARILRNEDVPAEEIKEVLDELRAGRVTTAEKKAAKTPRSTVKAIDPDDIFGEL